MHILIAPNAFKNSLTANEAAEAIEHGLKQSALRCTCETFPVGDGGDGTMALVAQKCKSTLVSAEATDPLGRVINTSFRLINNGKTALIEMADASGLRLLRNDEMQPLRASSFGTGELIKQALNTGVEKVIIGMGGSATIDGASGILSALGARFLDEHSGSIKALPQDLSQLYAFDLSNLDARILNCEVIVLCDVNNLLLGNNGAAAMFGPQKGASHTDVQTLEAALTKFSKVISDQTGKDIANVRHGGTAGGAAAGLYGLVNARLVNGIDYFLELTGFHDALQGCNLVITGEGSIDEQTLQGKGPFGVAAAAKKKGLPVVGVAGKVPLESHPDLHRYFDALVPIGHEPGSLGEAIQHTAANLSRASLMLGNLLSIQQQGRISR